LQRGYLGGRELATDFKHPETGKPYNPDFAAMARSAGVEGVRVDRAGDIGDAVRQAIAANKPYLIDANIGPTRTPAARACGSCRGSSPPPSAMWPAPAE
jgi:acetolactate synthase I/II/III large subunit